LIQAEADSLLNKGISYPLIFEQFSGKINNKYQVRLPRKLINKKQKKTGHKSIDTPLKEFPEAKSNKNESNWKSVAEIKDEIERFEIEQEIFAEKEKKRLYREKLDEQNNFLADRKHINAEGKNNDLAKLNFQASLHERLKNLIKEKQEIEKEKKKLQESKEKAIIEEERREKQRKKIIEKELASSYLIQQKAINKFDI